MTNTTSKSASSPAESIVQLGPETAACEWWNTADGATHFMRVWLSNQTQQTSPIVVYLHGIEGHSRWFEETALQLARHGISTYAADRRGAGASKESRGDIARFDRLIGDTHELLQLVSARHPGAPVIIVANCWGAKVGLAAAARDRQTHRLVRGIILISPAIAVQVDVALTTKLKIAWNYLLQGGTGQFDIPLTPEHFTDNPVYLDYVANDRLRLTKATARFFVESLKLTSVCKSAFKGVDMPVLVLQSGRDAIVQVSAIQQWFDSLSSSDKALNIFTSAAHSLDFEPEPSEYQNFLKEWILTRARSNVY